MKILIVGGANNASLAISQSLGQNTKEIDVIGIKGNFHKTFHSKYVRNKYLLDPLEKSLSAFYCVLSDIINSNQYDFVIPTNDRFSLALASPEFRNLITSSELVVPDHDILLKTMDKGAVAKLAIKHGCPVPETIFTDDDFFDSLDAHIEQLDMPVIIKPRFSWLIQNNRFHKGSVEFISKRDQLKKSLLRSHKNIAYPLIQKQIKGDAWGIELLFWDGEIKAAFSHKRVREANPLGSFSSAVQSIPLNETYMAYIQKMLSEVKWYGVCMFEFKNDDSTNIPKLMEINGRFWGSLPAAIRSGVNFPLYLMEAYTGQEISYNNTYTIGLKCNWIIEDLVHLGYVLKGKPKQWYGYYPDRKSTIREFLRFSEYHSYNNEKNDPLPGFLELCVEPLIKIKRKVF